MFAESFSVLTYNLHFNQALDVVPQIIEKYKPDVLCLQEVAVDKAKFRDFVIPGYALAAASGSFYRLGRTYGQANFYRQDRLIPTESRSILLPKAYYEILITLLTRKGPRTALCSDFMIKGLRHHKVSVYNLHLTHLVATNGTRIKQLCETLDSIDIDPQQSSVIAGDFNYLFRKRSLEEVIEKYHLNEATSNIVRTFRAQPWSTFERLINYVFPVSLKFDYVLHTSSLRCVETLVMAEFDNSDHSPVLSRFELK